MHKLYPLQTLFDLKEREKTAAEKAFIQARNQLAIEQKKLNELQKRLTALIDFRCEQQRKCFSNMLSTTANHLNIKNRHLKSLKTIEELCIKKIHTQENVIAEQRKIVDIVLMNLLAKDKKFRTMQKHQEKWRRRQNVVKQKHDEEVQDEVSQMQFINQLRARHVAY